MSMSFGVTSAKMTGIAIALAVVSSWCGHCAQAAGPALGVVFVTTPRGLFVRQVTSTTPFANLRVADEITAVNGRRVETEAAFTVGMARSNGAATIMVRRNGRVQAIKVGAGSNGKLNPSFMVMTSQGVMHRDAAIRLGLVGTPIHGTQEPGN